MVRPWHQGLGWVSCGRNSLTQAIFELHSWPHSKYTRGLGNSGFAQNCPKGMDIMTNAVAHFWRFVPGFYTAYTSLMSPKTTAPRPFFPKTNRCPIIKHKALYLRMELARRLRASAFWTLASATRLARIWAYSFCNMSAAELPLGGVLGPPTASSLTFSAWRRLSAMR